MLVGDLAEEWGRTPPRTASAKALAVALAGRVPCSSGAGLTAPVAYRWKSQVNENANRPAFWSELPELDHNEIEGWAERGPFEPVFLEDPAGAHPRIRRRFELTAEMIGDVHRVRARGETRMERTMSLVHLGDLVSLYIAALLGQNPAAVPALDRLKTEL